MSAESAEIEDPNDPVVIVRDLPEQERAEFLRQYHEAVDAAHDPGGYRQLQRLLRAWRLTVIATTRPRVAACSQCCCHFLYLLLR